MRVDPRSRSGGLLIRLGALLVRALVRGLFATCRIRVAKGQEQIDKLISGSEAFIISFWHNRTIPATYYLYRRVERRGGNLTILASHSRDGELAARIAESWGLSLLRGSASRGGRDAMRGVYRALKRGSSPLMIPDGPRGPLYRFKRGVVVLAQMARRPVLPMGFATRSYWRIKSWDRMIVPKPFSHVVVVAGEPLLVPRRFGDEELEAERRALEQAVDRVTLEAEDLVGMQDECRSVGEP